MPKQSKNFLFSNSRKKSKLKKNKHKMLTKNVLTNYFVLYKLTKFYQNKTLSKSYQ